MIAATPGAARFETTPRTPDLSQTDSMAPKRTPKMAASLINEERRGEMVVVSRRSSPRRALNPDSAQLQGTPAPLSQPPFQQPSFHLPPEIWFIIMQFLGYSGNSPLLNLISTNKSFYSLGIHLLYSFVHLPSPRTAMLALPDSFHCGKWSRCKVLLMNLVDNKGSSNVAYKAGTDCLARALPTLQCLSLELLRPIELATSSAIRSERVLLNTIKSAPNMSYLHISTNIVSLVQLVRVGLPSTLKQFHINVHESYKEYLFYSNVVEFLEMLDGLPAHQDLKIFLRGFHFNPELLRRLPTLCRRLRRMSITVETRDDLIALASEMPPGWLPLNTIETDDIATLRSADLFRAFPTIRQVDLASHAVSLLPDELFKLDLPAKLKLDKLVIWYPRIPESYFDNQQQNTDLEEQVTALTKWRHSIRKVRKIGMVIKDQTTNERMRAIVVRWKSVPRVVIGEEKDYLDGMDRWIPLT